MLLSSLSMLWKLFGLVLLMILALQHVEAAAADSLGVLVHLDSNVSKPIPPNFASFSVEVFGMQWWTSVYPKPTRLSFVNLILQLNNYTRGPLLPMHRRIFRIGGISADTSVYNPHLNLTIPDTLGLITYNISDADILGMDRAMEAVDGQIIVGLNFRLAHDPTWPLRHVQAIDRLVGWRRVFALEIGNEVSFYPGGDRPRGWTFANYSAEWGNYVNTFYKQVPSLPNPFFQGLACFGSEWLPYYAPFIDQYQDVLLTVSHHFYPESHSNPVNVTYLPKLHKLMTEGDAREESQVVAPTVDELSRKYPAVPFVIGEGNSVSGHGQLNVSTTFGACLWAVHEMMNDISVGVYSWQFHNNVLEDFTLSSYTAFIYQDLDSDVPTVMPLYYAMRFVTETTSNHARMVRVDLNTTNPLIHAFAFQQDGLRRERAEVRVIILHKDYNATAPASISVTLKGQQAPYATGRSIVLRADSIFSNFGLTYAGQTYDGSKDGLPNGQFHSIRVPADSSGTYQLFVEPASATLLTVPLSAADASTTVSE